MDRGHLKWAFSYSIRRGTQGWRHTLQSNEYSVPGCHQKNQHVRSQLQTNGKYNQVSWSSDQLWCGQRGHISDQRFVWEERSRRCHQHNLCLGQSSFEASGMARTTTHFPTIREPWQGLRNRGCRVQGRTPTQNNANRLCPPYYSLPHRIFRPSYGPVWVPQ